MVSVIIIDIFGQLSFQDLRYKLLSPNDFLYIKSIKNMKICQVYFFILEKRVSRYLRIYNLCQGRVKNLNSLKDIHFITIQVALVVKNQMLVQSLVWEDPLEEEMTTHSSILAWRNPWTEEPGELKSIGLQRVRHD